MISLTIKVLKISYPLIIFSGFLYIEIRILYIIKNKIKIDIINEIGIILFIIYNIFLFYIVTIPDCNYNIINIILFKEIKRYPVGSKLFIKNTIGNILLFIPYGLYISYHLKISKLFIILLLGVCYSLLIEIIQLKMGRVFDIDDILLNTVGCIVGYYFYQLIYKQ